MGVATLPPPVFKKRKQLKAKTEERGRASYPPPLRLKNFWIGG